MSDWFVQMQVDSDWSIVIFRAMDSTDFDEIPVILFRQFSTYLDLMLFSRVLVQF